MGRWPAWQKFAIFTAGAVVSTLAVRILAGTSLNHVRNLPAAVLLRWAAGVVSFLAAWCVARRMDGWRAWLIALGLLSVPIALQVATGVQWRGSTRWLSLGRGYFAVNEFAFGTILVATGMWTIAGRQRTWFALITLAGILYLVMIGSRTYAMICTFATGQAVWSTIRSVRARILLLASMLTVALWVVAHTGALWRIVDWALDRGAVYAHSMRLEELRKQVGILPNFTNNLPRVPHLVADSTFLLDARLGGWPLSLMAYGGVTALLLRQLKGPASPWRVFALGESLKGLCHIASSLGLVPVLGVPFPLLTGSGADCVVFGWLAGTAHVIHGKKSKECVVEMGGY